MTVTPNDTSPKTLLVNIGIIEDQNAIDGKSKLIFKFSSNLVQGDNTVQFAHHEKITCNGAPPLTLDNPPYTLSVSQGEGYNCSYTGYNRVLLRSTSMINVPARSVLAPQPPRASGTGYTINYNPDPPGRACSITADAKDSANNDVSGSASSSDQKVYQGPDITSLVGDGSILLQRTCSLTSHAPFDTVNLTYVSTASVDVTWSH